MFLNQSIQSKHSVAQTSQSPDIFITTSNRQDVVAAWTHTSKAASEIVMSDVSPALARPVTLVLGGREEWKRKD